MRRTISAAALFITSGAAAAAVVGGPAVVVDGDTFGIAGEGIRMFGVDAPERSQTCSREVEAWQQWRGRSRDRHLKSFVKNS